MGHDSATISVLAGRLARRVRPWALVALVALAPAFGLALTDIPAVAGPGAQQAPVVQKPIEYTITLSGDQILLIANLLKDQPYGHVVAILNAMQSQIDKENAERAKAKAPPKPTENPKR